MADFNDRFAPAMPGVDFAGRLAMYGNQQPGLIEDRRGDQNAQPTLADVMSRVIQAARMRSMPASMPQGSLAAQAGYNNIGQQGNYADLGSTEGHSVVQRFLKAMHKSPVVSHEGSSRGDSGFTGGFNNY